jgi:hypothetical protein
VFWTIGGTDPGAYAEAEVAGRLAAGHEWSRASSGATA